MTTDDYIALVPSQNAEKPKFIAMMKLSLDVLVHIQDLLQSMVPVFDVDTAIGQQLDVIGRWVGVSREIKIPISGVYFTWDADFTLGWDYGIWPQSEPAPANVTSLPDGAYRTLIKAKIAANTWDGTTDGAYAIWDKLFTQYTILIQDFQDMSYALAVVGGIVDSLTVALLVGGYIPLKPEAVRVNAYYVPINDGPIFAWDLENTLLKGWEEGSWARVLTPD